jgi:hypothetical protein
MATPSLAAAQSLDAAHHGDHQLGMRGGPEFTQRFKTFLRNG